MTDKEKPSSLGFSLLQCLAGPVKAGPKWVTYSRQQVEAMIEAAKIVMEKEHSK